MRKVIIPGIAITVIVIIVFMMASRGYDESDEIIVDMTGVESFELEYFLETTNNFRINENLRPDRIKLENVGVIDNYQLAVRRARDIFREYLSSTFDENKMIGVSYDAETEYWLLTVYSPPKFLDGEAIPPQNSGQTIVRSNGDIWAVWKPYGS